MYIPIHIECLDSISMVVSIIGDISTVDYILLNCKMSTRNSQMSAVENTPKKTHHFQEGVYSTGDIITMSCIRRSGEIDLEN